jgi:hypothetical protein
VIDVVVTGSRAFKNRKRVFDTLDSIHKSTPIRALAHGACGWDKDKPELQLVINLRGADRWAHEWALQNGVIIAAFPAAWSMGRGGAGPLRNKEMLDTFCPNLVVAFFDSDDNWGTRNCVREAYYRKIPIRRIDDRVQESLL